MAVRIGVVLYFLAWAILFITGLVLNALNVNWNSGKIAQHVILVLLLGILQGSIYEFPLQTMVTLFKGGKLRENPTADCEHLSVLLNYNLLAVSKDDVDECFYTMFQVYMGNLSKNTSIVLVSATPDEELRRYEIEVRNQYRTLIYDELFKEGVFFVNDDFAQVPEGRLRFVWFHYMRIPKMEFVRNHLHNICDQFAREFMLIHRKSKVLRKCGQYQDLMLLSMGDDRAYTYTDPALYGDMARPYNEPLFYDSEDVENIYRRNFDYTLVLDADTGVPDGMLRKILGIAAAHPDKGIIQPAIKFSYSEDDTLYMKLEMLRQKIYEPMTNANTELLGQCSFFGKGLIKNDIYINNVIGTRENPIERVPIDVLSHDTFEAAILKPYYAGSSYLVEAPCFNYISWNIRETRWNRGEILLAIYFWRRTFGIMMRGLQRLVQRRQFNKTTLRTESKLDFITAYIAHSALRQMFMKPILLICVFLYIGTDLRYPYVPIFVILFLVIVFPKFAVCTFQNFHYVLIETVASIWQFTPEAVVGVVRIARSLYANVIKKCKWVPQRSVEEHFKKNNPFLSSLKHLWLYSVISLIAIILLALFQPDSHLLFFLLATLCLLPLFTGFTSLTSKLETAKKVAAKQRKQLESFDSVNINRNYEEVWSTQTSYIPMGLYYNPSPYVNYAYSAEEIY